MWYNYDHFALDYVNHHTGSLQHNIHYLLRVAVPLWKKIPTLIFNIKKVDAHKSLYEDSYTWITDVALLSIITLNYNYSLAIGLTKQYYLQGVTERRVLGLLSEVVVMKAVTLL